MVQKLTDMAGIVPRGVSDDSETKTTRGKISPVMENRRKC